MEVPKDIDDYIAGLPEAVRPVMQEIRATIRQAVPGAEETISYAMPSFKLAGKVLVYFAAWKNHIGFYATPAGNAAFQADLAPFKQSKGAVQFPLSAPMPLALIARIATYRAEEIRAEPKARRKTPAP
jgi:uncharacterized protein YdhG (YjbR/CyaY superfamily)